MVGTNQEMKELLEENAELKQQLAEQNAHHEHELEQSSRKAQQLREDMRAQHDEHQRKLVQAENGYKVRTVILPIQWNSSNRKVSYICIREYLIILNPPRYVKLTFKLGPPLY